MQDDDIPDFDPYIGSRDNRDRILGAMYEQAQYDNLLAETGLVRWQAREVAQRVWVRIFVSVLAALVIVAMFVAFYHILHHVFGFRYLMLNSGALIALVVAPIASISGVTIALLVGAFRGFKDVDAAAAGAAVAASVTAAKGG